MTAPLPAGGSSLFRYNQLLTRTLNMKGGEPLETVAPELQPVFPLDTDRAWYARLRQETLWVSIGEVTGDATHPGILYIQNVVSSGIVTQIDGILLANRNAAAVLYRGSHQAGTSSGSAGNIFNRDNRVRGLPSTRALSNTTVAAPAGVDQFFIQLLPDTTFYVPIEYVLGEQNEFVIYTGANAQKVTATIFGRERPLEPGEKAPL